MAAIRSINDEATVLAQAEDRRRRAHRRWWRFGGLLALAVIAWGLAQIPRAWVRTWWVALVGPDRPEPPPPVVVETRPVVRPRGVQRRRSVSFTPDDLKSTDPAVRRKALDWFLRTAMPPESKCEALVAALKDPDEKVRELAATLLAKEVVYWATDVRQNAGLLDAAAPALLGVLSDDSPRVREDVLIGLGEILPVRMALTSLGGDVPATEAPAAVKALLKDPDPAVRLAAAALLVKVGDGHVAVDVLSEAYDREKLVFINNYVIGDLRGVGYTAWAQRHGEQMPLLGVLIDALKEPDRAVRRAAARALADVGRMDPANSLAHDTDDVADVLISILARSRDVNLRCRAIESLRPIVSAPDRIAKALRAAAGDPDPSVAATAVNYFRIREQEAQQRAAGKP
jgi:HEAT repeat protein